MKNSVKKIQKLLDELNEIEKLFDTNKLTPLEESKLKRIRSEKNRNTKEI